MSNPSNSIENLVGFRLCANAGDLENGTATPFAGLDDEDSRNVGYGHATEEVINGAGFCATAKEWFKKLFKKSNQDLIENEDFDAQTQ